ncbi:MAG TPA: chemotaxis protein CheW [Gammaproteobacteria bacterium]|jgi:purine-binding chemotaxis protein CheW|nr:chemotaxis protein CheW [Gammaproteobacteria bacterium]
MTNSKENYRFKAINFRTRDFMGSIDIENVIKIIAIPDLNIIPEGPEYIVGMFNLAGKIIPVVDLSMLLKTSQPKQYSTTTPIIICRNNSGNEFGILVDAVSDISDVTENMVEAAKENGQHIINGEIKYENNISLLIDVNRILVSDA